MRDKYGYLCINKTTHLIDGYDVFVYAETGNKTSNQLYSVSQIRITEPPNSPPEFYPTP